jgi:hypothetical protein
MYFQTYGLHEIGHVLSAAAIGGVILLLGV